MKYAYFLLLAIFVSQFTNAQYSHYLNNYTLNEYGAGNQNWDIAKAADGKLFAANNNGLLEFDGLNWNVWEMPNKTTIRSLLVYENKIFVGSYEEFGYFSRNNKGALVYSSLVNSPKKIDVSKDEEYWQIVLFGDAVIFRSFLNIHIYVEGKITSYNLSSTLMSCDVVNDKLYVSTLDKGIFVLENNELKPFFYSGKLNNAKIISITAKNDHKFLVNTALRGSFLLENNEITSWETPINSVIKKHQLNKFTQLPNGNMLFGTIKNGIYITDNYGQILFNINKETGLINNTVLGQYVTKNNELWLGLDNGIAFVDLNTPNYFFNDISGKLGAVYDIIKYKNTIYIGSNTGLYFIDASNKLQFIEGSQGQVWDLEEIDGDLFCGHNNGTYLVKNNTLKLISAYTGGWVINKVPEQKNTYVQGTYAGLVSFKKVNGEWQVKHLGKTTIPARFLVFEDEHTAWIAHANKGLYRVKFDENYETITELIDYNKKGLWSDYFVRIYKLKNTIAFRTLKGWQKYETLMDSIIPYNLLNEKITKGGYIISEENDTEMAYKTENSLSFSSLSNESRNILIPDKYFKKRLITGYENVSKINDSIFALNLYDGFMFIDAAKFKVKESLKKPTLSKITINNQPIALDTNNISLPFRNNAIAITVNSPFSKDHSFEYKLSSLHLNPPWTESKNGVLEFSNLTDGTYNLAIRTLGYNKEKSPVLTLEFTVLSPWYKNTAGFIVYTFILMLISTIIYYFHKRKIKKEQKLLQIMFEETQNKILEERKKENEKEIIRLKNESLKNEIKLKSKQLANTAISLVKKNETLLHLKDELLSNKTNFNNQYSFKKLIKQIDNSIEHEDGWELFEYNFNQVHEEFFNQLKASFPSLTHKDLKICAYLRMNMSSKEIAPLLNISIRGVETNRYRLKIKLGIPKEGSLRGFLQNFN
ncbi:MAG: transcriptional regulator [Bacteroidetes bacterium HGW-Bacteroidetes-18]|nr:MAG: transcriptional regulator [Bacteroidetes bacterium HGW-Bacteroidetes-18]